MIAIAQPLPIAALAASSGSASLASLSQPSPREIWQSASSATHFIDIDLGSAQTLDLVYIGATNAAPGSTWSIARGTGMGTGLTIEATGPVALSGASGPRYQSVLHRPDGAPATRYLRVSITCPAAQILEMGLLVVGRTFEHAYAYGAGRQLIDTSTRADLRDGGFGIDAGISKAKFSWRFVDLSAAECETLWSIVADRGIRRPIVVVEDLTASPLPDAAVHYGLFDKFEQYERANAVDTVWALSMTEWR